MAQLAAVSPPPSAPKPGDDMPVADYYGHVREILARCKRELGPGPRSISDLALMLGADQGTLQRRLRGQRPLPAVLAGRIAGALGVSFEEAFPHAAGDVA